MGQPEPETDLAKPPYNFGIGSPRVILGLEGCWLKPQARLKPIPPDLNRPHLPYTTPKL